MGKEHRTKGKGEVWTMKKSIVLYNRQYYVRVQYCELQIETLATDGHGFPRIVIFLKREYRLSSVLIRDHPWLNH